jgi:succinate-acetate transporter protein
MVLLYVGVVYLLHVHWNTEKEHWFTIHLRIIIYLFFLLALRDWGFISGAWIGYEGIICGFSAFYVAIAEVLNETYGKTILPLGKPIIK